MPFEVLKKHFKEVVAYKGFHESHDNLKSGFVVVVGTMPSHTIIYDECGNPKFELCKLHRNLLQLSRNKRFMLVGGFGNLPCDYEL